MSRLRTSFAAVAVVTTLLATVPAVASAAGRAAAKPAVASAKVVARSKATVTLPTGDLVTVTGNGRGQKVTVQPAAASGPGRTLSVRHVGTDTFVLPAVAEPYLGRVLDKSLFDVTELLPLSRPQGRVPVRLRYTGSTPSVPGVTVTSAAGGKATGYLTVAGAREFGAALVKQWKSDSAAGWPKHASLFGGVTVMQADGAASPASTVSAQAAQFPMRTLVIKAIGVDGKPLEEGYGLLFSVDDGRKYIGDVIIEDGEARVSVPDGTYSGVFEDYEYHEPTDTAVDAVVTLTEYAVTGAGQTLTVDARTATVEPRVTTPKPAALGDYGFEWDRSDAKGYQFVSFGFGADSSTTIKLAPAGPATVGTLDVLHTWNLVGGGGAYRYNLAAPDDRIPATVHPTFTTAELATVNSGFYTDGPQRDAAFLRFPVYPFQFFSGGLLGPISTPTSTVFYVAGKGDPLWGSAFIAYNDSFDDPGFVDAPVKILAPGSSRTENWMRGPLEAAIPVQKGPVDYNGRYCYACRTSKSLSIALAPFTDTTSDHVGELFAALDGLPVARFRLYRSGRKVFDKDDYLGARVKVPTGKHTYKAVLDVDRRLTGTTQSTRTNTVLGFSSKQGSGASAPSSWYCQAGSGNGCRVLPILQAHLKLPTTLNGRLPASTSTVRLLAGRIQGATASPVTSATLEVRPAGDDWQPVPLKSAGGGEFRGRLDNTEWAGSDVDVRISARDAGGSRFTETVLKAYTVAGA